MARAERPTPMTNKQIAEVIIYCDVCGSQLIGRPAMCAEHGEPAPTPPPGKARDEQRARKACDHPTGFHSETWLCTVCKRILGLIDEIRDDERARAKKLYLDMETLENARLRAAKEKAEASLVRCDIDITKRDREIDALAERANTDATEIMRLQGELSEARAALAGPVVGWRCATCGLVVQSKPAYEHCGGTVAVWKPLVEGEERKP